MATTTPTAYGLGDKPPFRFAALVGLQHLLAVFGGIVTAPLLIALGMQLPPADTTYLISSALFVSGIATLLQVSRIGPVGSGLLSIQGTSFTFIGPLIYLYSLKTAAFTSAEALGFVFAACLICALLISALSPFIHTLRHVLTRNVSATIILLLGLTLVWTTVGNINRSFQQALQEDLPIWPLILLSVGVFSLILLLATSRRPTLRMSSIVIGLATGFVAAIGFGMVSFDQLGQQPVWFVPEWQRYPFAVDWTLVAILLPVFLVSVTESIGDLTATASLSGLEAKGPSFWRRLRGGILADSINSAIAAAVCTFPNTTFSQNNGVIRLTGVSSRRVGRFVGLFLIALGAVPLVAAVVQLIPGIVIASATLLMFVMVIVSGYQIAASHRATQRDWSVISLAIGCGLLTTTPWAAPLLDQLPPAVSHFFGFPISSGAFFAILLDVVVPGRQTREM
ncbi:MAG: solute carrier family 23 protein [Pseudomonadota bacterium]